MDGFIRAPAEPKKSDDNSVLIEITWVSKAMSNNVGASVRTREHRHMQVEVGGILQPKPTIGLLLEPCYGMKHIPAQGKSQERHRRSLLNQSFDIA